MIIISFFIFGIGALLGLYLFWPYLYTICKWIGYLMMAILAITGVVHFVGAAPALLLPIIGAIILTYRRKRAAWRN